MLMEFDGCLWHWPNPTFFTSTDSSVPGLAPSATDQTVPGGREISADSAVPWVFFVRKPPKNMRENIAETWGNHGQNPRKITDLRWQNCGESSEKCGEHPLNFLKLTLRLTKFWVVENCLPAPSSAGSNWGGNEHIGNMVEQMLQWLKQQGFYWTYRLYTI